MFLGHLDVLLVMFAHISVSVTLKCFDCEYDGLVCKSEAKLIECQAPKNEFCMYREKYEDVFQSCLRNFTFLESHPSMCKEVIYLLAIITFMLSLISRQFGSSYKCLFVRWSHLSTIKISQIICILIGQ